MRRLFKPGDRVQLRSGGPVMEIIKYVEVKDLFSGSTVSNAKVLCVWYDRYKRRNERIFHQNSLAKASMPSDFMADKLKYLRRASI